RVHEVDGGGGEDEHREAVEGLHEHPQELGEGGAARLRQVPVGRRARDAHAAQAYRRLRADLGAGGVCTSIFVAAVDGARLLRWTKLEDANATMIAAPLTLRNGEPSYPGRPC